MGKALGKSPALWESPWDGSWRGGCRKGLEQRGPEGLRSKNVLRLIVAVCVGGGRRGGVLARASCLEVQRSPGGSDTGVREPSETLRAEEAGEFKNSQETLTWRGPGRGAKGKGSGELLGESEEGGDLQGAKEGSFHRAWNSTWRCNKRCLLRVWRRSKKLGAAEGSSEGLRVPKGSEKELRGVPGTEGWGKVF